MIVGVAVFIVGVVYPGRSYFVQLLLIGGIIAGRSSEVVSSRRF